MLIRWLNRAKVPRSVRRVGVVWRVGGSRSAAGGKGVPLGQARLAVQKSPHDSRAWQTLAQAHHQVGDVRIALAAVRRAAALDRKWAGSPEGRSMLKQYAHDARHPGPPRSGH